MNLSDEEVALLQSSSFIVNYAIRFTFFAKNDLPLEKVYLCTDSHDLTTPDPADLAQKVTWMGAGKLLNTPTYKTAFDSSTQRVSFTVSGVDADLFRLAITEAERVRGAQIIAFLILQKPSGAPVGAPIAMYAVTGDNVTYSASKSSPRDPELRQITLTANSILATQSRSPLAFYSDPDQRYITSGGANPVDEFCKFVATLTDKTLVWPKYD